MSMATNLRGRLRNTSLPYASGLLAVFEAVVNAIHAIEDATLSSDQGRITVEILRDKQSQMNFSGERKRRGPEPEAKIVGFKVTDNGIGFSSTNMNSFRTLDSEYKAKRGGRGVGRLLWLKAFKRVHIASTFVDAEGRVKYRQFVFRPDDGVTDEELCDASSSERETCVYLQGFHRRYREASRKTAPAIASSLLEHSLWYFIRKGGAPHIVIVDGDEHIELDQVYEEQMVSEATADTLRLKNIDFDLVHVKLSASAMRTHSIAFCAANRLVMQESLKGKIPGLCGSLRDGEGEEFVYECYVSSSLLDDRVRSERTGFDIEEEPLTMFAGELSQKEIRDSIIAKACEFLAKYLAEKKKLGKDRIAQFVDHKAPRYRPILARIPEDQLVVDPEISDKDLDLLLHRQLAEIENRILAEGHDIMIPEENESCSDYQSRLDAYLGAVQDLKQSDLANYVSHRKVIIDLLENVIQREHDGTYAREELIHNLIMPMRKDSVEVPSDRCNLWLIDERLAFHDYLASDKPLSSMPITDSSCGKEPDLLALHILDNPTLVSEGTQLPPASLSIVEIKRPMRNDASQGEEKDPIEQALGYLDRIRQGKVTTSRGRPIPQSDQIPGFCYVLCDLTPTILQRCRIHDAIRTSDGLGYFFYSREYRAYVEVISFDRLINVAKERNRAFFDKLGLPAT